MKMKLSVMLVLLGAAALMHTVLANPLPEPDDSSPITVRPGIYDVVLVAANNPDDQVQPLEPISDDTQAQNADDSINTDRIKRFANNYPPYQPFPQYPFPYHPAPYDPNTPNNYASNYPFAPIPRNLNTLSIKTGHGGVYRNTMVHHANGASVHNHVQAGDSQYHSYEHRLK